MRRGHMKSIVLRTVGMLQRILPGQRSRLGKNRRMSKADKTPVSQNITKSAARHRIWRWKEDRIKMKAMGTSELSIARENVELRYLEQLKDQEQSMALAYLLKYAQLKMMDGRKSMRQIGDLLEEQLDRSGLESLFERGDVSSQLARPRKQEIMACINRYRRLKM